ncbi:MAG: dihydroxyacetone kinase subunit DhaK, partial [Polaromonas sp.]
MINFYNEKRNIVSDAIDGLIAARGGKLRRFDPSSHARVVVRSDWDRSNVAIVSGGGSGHEPAHAGLVGPGLLTAAVCGDVYGSPSVDAVLSAILEVTGPNGCLLVIMNYTGDRLNFGLAAEKAKAMGYKVEMVVVGDDIAIADAPRPRGVAGTVFMHKLVGYLSEKGASLEEILVAANYLNARIFTLGVARDTCTVPGNEKPSRIAVNEVEIGLGIHGEPGVDVKSFSDCSQLMKDFSARLMSKLDPSKRYIALFNNLGGLNGLECSILFKELMASDLAKVIDYTMGPVAIMTALDMPGFSVSMVPLEKEYELALTSEIDFDAWPTLHAVVKAAPIVPKPLPAVAAYAPSGNRNVRRVIETVIQACLTMESDLNELDSKVGDGDTGTTFAAAARTVNEHLDSLPFAKGDELFAVLSDLKSKLMGGSSGVLFAILFANASSSYK